MPVMTPAGERPQAPILVFDIETVPDIGLLQEIHEPTLEFEPEPATAWRDLRIATAAYKVTGKDFPPPMFHVVVCICAVFVNPETYTIMDGFKRSVPLVVGATREDFLAAERELLRSFWAFATKHRDFSRVWYDSQTSDFRMSEFQRRKMKPVPVTFCGYNTSGFDLPVIEQRSLRHLLTCPITEYGRETGYDSYRSRFAPEKSFDLFSYISGNSSLKSGLDVVSRALGLGGKMEGMDGSKVAQAYYVDQQWAAIEEYCAIDVLITHGVLLAVQKFRGILPDEDFREAAAHFEKFLRQEGKPPSYLRLADASRPFFQAARGDAG